MARRCSAIRASSAIASATSTRMSMKGQPPCHAQGAAPGYVGKRRGPPCTPRSTTRAPRLGSSLMPSQHPPLAVGTGDVELEINSAWGTMPHFSVAIPMSSGARVRLNISEYLATWELRSCASCKTRQCADGTIAQNSPSPRPTAPALAIGVMLDVCALDLPTVPSCDASNSESARGGQRRMQAVSRLDGSGD